MESTTGLTLQFTNNRRDLERVLDQLESRLGGTHPQTVKVARLVLEEMGSNIIKYGYDDDAPHVVRVRFKPGPPARLIIEDDGHPFNPLRDAPPPGLDDALAARRLGGLGIHMVKAMTATQRYQRTEGRNRFTVTFR